MNPDQNQQMYQYVFLPLFHGLGAYIKNGFSSGSDANKRAASFTIYVFQRGLHL